MGLFKPWSSASESNLTIAYKVSESILTFGDKLSDMTIGYILSDSILTNLTICNQNSDDSLFFEKVGGVLTNLTYLMLKSDLTLRYNM